MDIRFFGVRGSVATSGPKVARIGGNTSCLELTSQGERLILDAGTGLRALGEEMMKGEKPMRATMLWSHLHWDHVQGFPFFTPAYVPGTELTMYGPGPDGDRTLRETLAQQMLPPQFPVPMSVMRSTMHFKAARHLAAFDAGPFRITPLDLNHPQGCLGYHVEADGKRFVYMTDVECSLATLPKNVAQAIEGCDALVLDAQYTPDEYTGKQGAPKIGWGHSTFVDAAQIAKAVSAKRLFLFHHDPSHNDDQVEEMAEGARQEFAPSEPAREGKRIVLAA